ncbi:hypothetical protein KIPB_000708 [Kipferlia bialata]|uniref:Uncharacterized protein n=1 Tax=Kipferlia bialata TaxID=797122 RepID=A0A9K3CMX5_9EUKA|nr:hypothetical protein KIPB_000708 [Kipferlia bialata]|eukprot:g708.t1
MSPHRPQPCPIATHPAVIHARFSAKIAVTALNELRDTLGAAVVDGVAADVLKETLDVQEAMVRFQNSICTLSPRYTPPPGLGLENMEVVGAESTPGPELSGSLHSTRISSSWSRGRESASDEGSEGYEDSDPEDNQGHAYGEYVQGGQAWQVPPPGVASDGLSIGGDLGLGLHSPLRPRDPIANLSPSPAPVAWDVSTTDTGQALDASFGSSTSVVNPPPTLSNARQTEATQLQREALERRMMGAEARRGVAVANKVARAHSLVRHAGEVASQNRERDKRTAMSLQQRLEHKEEGAGKRARSRERRTSSTARTVSSQVEKAQFRREEKEREKQERITSEIERRERVRSVNMERTLQDTRDRSAIVDKRTQAAQSRRESRQSERERALETKLEQSDRRRAADIQTRRTKARLAQRPTPDRKRGAAQAKGESGLASPQDTVQDASVWRAYEFEYKTLCACLPSCAPVPWKSAPEGVAESLAHWLGMGVPLRGERATSVGAWLAPLASKGEMKRDMVKGRVPSDLSALAAVLSPFRGTKANPLPKDSLSWVPLLCQTLGVLSHHCTDQGSTYRLSKALASDVCTILLGILQSTRQGQSHLDTYLTLQPPTERKGGPILVAAAQYTAAASIGYCLAVSRARNTGPDASLPLYVLATALNTLRTHDKGRGGESSTASAGGMLGVFVSSVVALRRYLCGCVSNPLSAHQPRDATRSTPRTQASPRPSGKDQSNSSEPLVGQGLGPAVAASMVLIETALLAPLPSVAIKDTFHAALDGLSECILRPSQPRLKAGTQGRAVSHATAAMSPPSASALSRQRRRLATSMTAPFLSVSQSLSSLTTPPPPEDSQTLVGADVQHFVGMTWLLVGVLARHHSVLLGGILGDADPGGKTALVQLQHITEASVAPGLLYANPDTSPTSLAVQPVCVCWGEAREAVPRPDRKGKGKAKGKASTKAHPAVGVVPVTLGRADPPEGEAVFDRTLLPRVQISPLLSVGVYPLVSCASASAPLPCSPSLVSVLLSLTSVNTMSCALSTWHVAETVQVLTNTPLPFFADPVLHEILMGCLVALVGDSPQRLALLSTELAMETTVAFCTEVSKRQKGTATDNQLGKLRGTVPPAWKTQYRVPSDVIVFCAHHKEAEADAEEEAGS